MLSLQTGLKPKIPTSKAQAVATEVYFSRNHRDCDYVYCLQSISCSDYVTKMIKENQKKRSFEVNWNTFILKPGCLHQCRKLTFGYFLE